MAQEKNKPNDKDHKERSCTDIFCLILFVSLIGGMCYVTFLAWTEGDPYRLLYGVDSWGNTCNRDNTALPDSQLPPSDLTGKKKLFYFDPTSLSTSLKLCVKECPDETINSTEQLKSYSLENDRLCRYEVPIDWYGTDQQPEDACPSTPLPATESILNRCIAEGAVTMGLEVGSDAVIKALDGAFSALKAQCDSAGTIFEQIGSDMEHSWKEIVYLCSCAVGVAFVMTFLMRFLAPIIVWVLVIGAALGSLAGTAFCWYTWYDEKSTLDSFPEDSKPEALEERVKSWLIYAGVASGATVIILLVLLIMRKRIKLVVQLFREAGKAIGSMPALLLTPILTLIILFGSLFLMMIVFLYIQTSGSYTVEADTYLATFDMNELLKNLRWFYLFGILWVLQFIIACYQLTVAGAVAMWYFTRNKKKLGWPILLSIKRLIRYHLGSVAFGAFIIALIQFARIVLEYVDRKLKVSDNKVAKYLMCLLKCCLWLFEKVMKFINRNAYIMIAIEGCSFCAGCRKAFKLILNNIMRVAAVNSVGTFCLFLGKLAVIAIVAVIGIQIFKDNNDLCFIWSPIMVGCVFAFGIAHVFFSVYAMTMDTVLLCFCQDSEENDGITKPYFMSKGLMEFVSNADKVKKLAEKGSDPAMVASQAVRATGAAPSTQW